MYYINAAQGSAILRGLRREGLKELEEAGRLHGLGVKQLESGELTLLAHYLPGSITGEIPEQIDGFRITAEEREIAKAC